MGQGETVNETIGTNLKYKNILLISFVFHRNVKLIYSANSHDDDNWSADALRTISFDEDESNPINVRGFVVYFKAFEIKLRMT